MPKINVYLPDDLAEAVKEAGIPVSAICQRTLEQAVRRIADVRAVVAGELPPDDAFDQFTQLTQRCRQALTLAIGQVGAEGGSVLGTGHVLGGILAEGANLALRILRAVDVDLDQLADEIARHSAAEPSQTGGGDGRKRFSGPASSALQGAVTEAIALGHNYVGCEHVLLGLAAENEGIAGAALRAQGVDHRTLHRAVVAAMAGYVHLRAQAAPVAAATTEGLVADAVRRELAPLTERLAALERRVGVDGRP